MSDPSPELQPAALPELPPPTEPLAEPPPVLLEKVRALPRTPGVYLMRDAKGRVVYVGKAKCLRNRVGSYFQDTKDQLPKVRAMMAEVVDLDFLEAHSEADALLMESRLIKDIQPKYNKALKDDKTYPYIELTIRDDFPGVFLTRTPQAKGTKLYGPFTSANWTREAIDRLQRVFKYRTCTLEIDASDEKRRHFRPCLLYHINQCTAPCADRISRDDYRRDIERFKRFMEGNRQQVLDELQAEMLEASNELRFDAARRLRDQIRAIQSLSQRGQVKTHAQPEAFHTDPAEGLVKLQKLLSLPVRPRIIEGIDIAHLQGHETVGSLVCFLDGRPHKAGYRKFQIKTVEGVDDFASIREVVTRRYGRLAREALAATDGGEPAEPVFPDVVLIDGGPGQLSAAAEALRALNIAQEPKLISLAKREELLFIQGRSEPVRLARNHATLRLLQYVRDEAHRFAQHYHHILRSRSTFETAMRAARRQRSSAKAGRAVAAGSAPAPEIAGSAAPLPSAPSAEPEKSPAPRARRPRKSARTAGHADAVSAPPTSA